MARLGLVSEEDMKLDYILELSTAKLMDRRLQTKVFKLGIGKSIHHARKLIQQRHIRVGKQVVNSPSFMVHVDSEKHIQLAENSPLGGGRPVGFFNIMKIFENSWKFLKSLENYQIIHS